MTIDIEHNGTRIVTEADLIALIDERDRLATHAELMQRQRDFRLKQLEKAEQDRIARERWYRTLLGDHYRLRKERDRLAKENADYREGFDSDGCTAAESCCGEIKGALADKIERLEKELAEQKDEVKRIFGYSEDEMCLARFRRRTEHPSAEPEVKP